MSQLVTDVSNNHFLLMDYQQTRVDRDDNMIRFYDDNHNINLPELHDQFLLWY